jgi:hypothetical protein
MRPTQHHPGLDLQAGIGGMSADIIQFQMGRPTFCKYRKIYTLAWVPQYN